MSDRYQDTETREAMAALLPGLVAALVKETGAGWKVTATEEWDGGLFRSAFVTRSDGFTIRLARYWQNADPGKVSVAIHWPADPRELAKVPGHHKATWTGTRYKDAPGVSISAEEPGLAFNPAKVKNPATLARRIVRELLGEEMDSAWFGIVERWKQEAERRNTAAHWREAVAAAAGGSWRDNGSGTPYFSNYPAQNGVDISTRGADFPGGKIELSLSEDPETAAAQVAGIMAAMGIDSVAVARAHALQRAEVETRHALQEARRATERARYDVERATEIAQAEDARARLALAEAAEARAKAAHEAAATAQQEAA